MKALDIALKDLTRSFRSAFAIVFMFGIPLLVTGMFYFMFGNSASGDLSLPGTKVIIANLDQVNLTLYIPEGQIAFSSSTACKPAL